MAYSARVSFIRIAPRKMIVLADEVRGKSVNEALKALAGSRRKRSAGIVSKLLKSAVANADQKGTADVDNLYVQSIMVGGGPILKRFRPRAKGSASSRFKRTSHVTVTLAER